MSKQHNDFAEKLGNRIFALETNFDTLSRRIDEARLCVAIYQNIESLKALKKELLGHVEIEDSTTSFDGSCTTCDNYCYFCEL